MKTKIGITARSYEISTLFRSMQNAEEHMVDLVDDLDDDIENVNHDIILQKAAIKQIGISGDYNFIEFTRSLTYPFHNITIYQNNNDTEDLEIFGKIGTGDEDTFRFRYNYDLEEKLLKFMQLFKDEFKELRSNKS